MPDTPTWPTSGRLFSVEVDGYGHMVAIAPGGREMARVHVKSELTEAHVEAARSLVELVFADLQAQGYPRAYDDLN